MEKKISLKNSQIVKIHNLLTAYRKTGMQWSDHLDFQLFVIKNRRLLEGYAEDFKEFANSFVEWKEYERLGQELIKKVQENPEFDYQSSLKELEDEFKDSEEIEKVLKFLEKELEVVVEVIGKSHMPKGFPMEVLELLYELIDFEG